MIFVGVSVLLVQPPICAAENEHGAHVSHCASIAATFIGWYVVSITPRWLPTIRTTMETGTRKTMDSFAVRTNSAMLCFFRRCQADTESISRAPVTRDARITWRYPQTNTGLVI